VDEEIFRKKVHKEMELVQQKSELSKSKYSIWQKYSINLTSNFTHTYHTLENQRKQVIIGHEVISNQMVYKYLDMLKDLRFSIRSLQ
jgi:translation initiation factor 2 alpha subunit (eIF-2alpha)